MILTAHQPVYLPWLGLFHKIAMADVFVSYDDVQYCPKDYQNRNKIWTLQGPLWLTVPVRHNRWGPGSKICDVQILQRQLWLRKHWKSILYSYRKAAYWNEYGPALQRRFYASYYSCKLAPLNDDMLRWFLDVLGIKVEFKRASELELKGEKSARVLDMCQKLGADTYIFGALGRDYADVAAFEKAGIKVILQDYQHPVYSQFGGDFVPNLSIIDLLFHHGPKAKQILMGQS